LCRRAVPPHVALQDPRGRAAAMPDRAGAHRRGAHARCRGPLRRSRAEPGAVRGHSRIHSHGCDPAAGFQRRRRAVSGPRGQKDLMSKRIRKAVFPVAGLGTRFLPATKTVPKEMLPIIDRPLIQYAVDEAIEAGCDTLVFITNRYKHAVADYFDKAYELEQKLERAGKLDLLEQVRNPLPAHVRTIFVTQQEALGLGHAVLCAKEVIGDAPFAVLLPDDLIWNRGNDGALKQMADHAERSGGGVIAVQDVPREKTSSYGIAATGQFEGRAGRIEAMVEKPAPADAPSTLAVVGRYVLP